ncbi:MAG: hypothetical protein Q9172_006835 [Xanthocarpia lactea]
MKLSLQVAHPAIKPLNNKANVAKRLLFQFHKQQNSKKPGSVHAVYLVTGFTIPVTPTDLPQTEQADGEDAHMQSSPFMSSSMPQQEDEEEPLAVKTVTLCREEDLEGEKIFNLNLCPLPEHSEDRCISHKDQRSKRGLAEKYLFMYTAWDPAPYRTGPRPSPAQSTPVASRGTIAPKASNPAVKPETEPNQAREPKAPLGKAVGRIEAKPKEETPQQSSQQKKTTTKAPNLKREKSDIFKSFAKAPNKVSRENTESSAGASPVPKVETPAAEEVPKVPEDESMDDASDGEQLEDTLISEEKSANSKRGTRSEREDQLKKLLDDDDDDEAIDTPGTDDGHQTREQEPTTEVSEKRGEQEPATSAAVASGGRRRGRRKVMKKKTMKDEEGYLGTLSSRAATSPERANLERTPVTIEEPGWESFSEDEPVAKEATPSSTSSSNPKGKKMAGRPGQGNIMSFFGKK